jgi:hypothetical protein
MKGELMREITEQGWSVSVGGAIERVCDAAREVGFVIGGLRCVADGGCEIPLVSPDLETIFVRVGPRCGSSYAADFRTRFNLWYGKSWSSVDWFISKLPEIRAGRYVVEVSRNEWVFRLLLNAIGKTVIRRLVKTVYWLAV